MKSFCLTVFLCLGTLFSVHAQTGSYDLVIVSGTPSGIMAGIAAGKMGKRSLILERTAHAGGMVANGLGATDLITRGATGGLFLEFINRIKTHYVTKYGAQSQQVKDCVNGYHFEPSVAEMVLHDMLKEAPMVTLLTNREFEADPANLIMNGKTITGIKVLNRETGKTEQYTGKFFIDASYEGDLIAAAGVPFSLGREGIKEYNEPYAGVVYKLWASNTQEEGSTNMADNAIQAYNYRLCLTTDPAKRVAIPKPANYNREEYASIVEDVLTGHHAGIEYKQMTQAQKDSNARLVAQGLPPAGKYMPQGMQRLVNKVILPNGKTDANNQHRALVSTDLPEENWAWPSSSWEWRDRFAQRLKDYTLGLLWFGQNDPALPEWFRKECKEWGFANDEFADNGNFPRQVYVREGRRMRGMYLFTAADATVVNTGGRPPVHASSLTASHYGIDSHATRKREKDRHTLEGFLSYGTAPYTVPYGVIVPPNVTNLLAPVPASATHLGLATLRMEPCWMALGQAAGVAAVVSIETQTAAQDIAIKKVQDELISQRSILIYYKDVNADHPRFRALQFLGLQGYIPGWEAKLEDKVSATDLAAWEKLSKTKLRKNFTVNNKRGEVLQWIFEKIKNQK